MEIPIHAKVHCADGPGGRARRLIVDPTSKRVTHMVVAEGGASHAERLVPFRYVQEAGPQRICLCCSRHKLSEMKPLVETQLLRTSVPDPNSYPYTSAPSSIPRWVPVRCQSLAPRELGVGVDSRVMATDGSLGTLCEVCVEPGTGHITHLVLRPGRLRGRATRTIPAAEIDRIEGSQIYLKRDRKALASLPIT